jgi:predicted lipoprotein with Yx(FWY)xxD motif
MSRTTSSPRGNSIVIAAAGGALAVLLAGCGASSGASAGPTSGGVSPSSPAPNSTAASSAISTASTPVGKVLVDGQGHAIYVFAADQPGHSTCTGSCLTYWPPVPAPTPLPTDPSGVSAKFGVLTRPDGSRQLTVDGWPAYTYVGDTSPGMISGQGANLSGGLWWVVSTSGSAVTTSASAGSTASSPSTSGGYGY